jgi:hypothetical protein
LTGWEGRGERQGCEKCEGGGEVHHHVGRLIV